MIKKSKIYLVPCFLDENSLEVLPAYLKNAVADCKVFFVENERSARRFLKSIWKEIIIDDYEWFTIHKAEETVRASFIAKIKEGKNIGIISEAGCPGIADPGQALVQIAHESGAWVKPLVGPSSILLALMASGMNGQQFQFVGYLPIDAAQRTKKIKELETESHLKNCTQIFIETPYRNEALANALLTACKSSTRLCIAVNLTGKKESISTKSIADWKNNLPELNKIPAIFLMLA